MGTRPEPANPPFLFTAAFQGSKRDGLETDEIERGVGVGSGTGKRIMRSADNAIIGQY